MTKKRKTRNLTLADLTSPQRIIASEIERGGEVLTVHHRPLSAGDALRFMALMQEEGEPVNLVRAALEMAEKYVTHEDGSPLFDSEAVLQVPIEELIELMGALAGGGRKGEGEGEGDAGNA